MGLEWRGGSNLARLEPEAAQTTNVTAMLAFLCFLKSYIYLGDVYPSFPLKKHSMLLAR